MTDDRLLLINGYLLITNVHFIMNDRYPEPSIRCGSLCGAYFADLAFSTRYLLLLPAGASVCQFRRGTGERFAREWCVACSQH